MIPYCSVLLRTAEAEEISKRDFRKIKNEIAEREKNMADIKKKTLEAEHFTALIKRNTTSQNQLWSRFGKLFFPSSPDVPALLPSAMLPRQAWGTHKKTVCKTY